MKEIKAYIRRDEVNEIVEKLHDAGALGVSIIKIHPVDYGYEPNGFARNRAGLVERYRYLAVVKLEIFCGDGQLEPLLAVIQGFCRTGNPGDGMILVSEVADAVRIREGVRGEGALTHGPRRTAYGAAPGMRGVTR